MKSHFQVGDKSDKEKMKAGERRVYHSGGLVSQSKSRALRNKKRDKLDVTFRRVNADER